MVQDVADFRSNLNETILFVAKILGRSNDRRKVFEEIYRGKKRFKTVGEIAKRTRLTRMRVLQEGGKLAGNHIVTQGKLDSDTAYGKDATLSQHRDRILSIVQNPSKGRKLPTKQRPHTTQTTSYTFKVRTASAKPREITIDDVTSFKLVHGVKPLTGFELNKMAERDVKDALKNIIGETHDFKDWGGEKNDLYTNKFRVKNNRIAAAFALKGRATQGTLTPKKMGANGDQIQRLFLSAADVFFVVYHGKIDESIVQLMRALAVAEGVRGRSIHYGIIDGDDLSRLYQAYRSSFD